MKRNCGVARVVVVLLTLLVICPLCMAQVPERLLLHGYASDASAAPVVIEERDAAEAVVRQVVYARGRPLWQVHFDGSSQYFHEDPRGNAAAITEGAGAPVAAAGDVLERLTCDPYLKPVLEDPENLPVLEGTGEFAARSQYGNTLLCAGLWYDPETGSRTGNTNTDYGGFYLSGSRFYNPDEGRYTTRGDDPPGSQQPRFGSRHTDSMNVVLPPFHPRMKGDFSRAHKTYRRAGAGRYAQTDLELFSGRATTAAGPTGSLAAAPETPLGCHPYEDFCTCDSGGWFCKKWFPAVCKAAGGALAPNGRVCILR